MTVQIRLRAGSAQLQEQSDQREGTTRLTEQSLPWEGTTRFRQSIRVHRQTRKSERSESIWTIVHLASKASLETSGRPREGNSAHEPFSRYNSPTANCTNNRQDTRSGERIAEPKTPTIQPQGNREPAEEARVNL
jgi:hypothetical protein